jgi:hypothetical protein
MCCNTVKEEKSRKCSSFAVLLLDFRRGATSFEFQEEKSRKCSSFARLLKKPFKAMLSLSKARD